LPIYPRVSTEKQKKEGYGLTYQERLCREWAEQHGWEIVGVYPEDFTGRLLDDRPAMSAIRKLVPTQTFDYVLSIDMDRTLRKHWHYGYLTDEWEPYGVEWRFVGEPDWLDQEMLEPWRVMQAMFAEMKYDDILKKTRNGRIERGRDGLLMQSGTPLYGYRYCDVVRDNGTIKLSGGYEIVEEEAEIVREVFERYNQGESLGRITADLNLRRVPTRHGGKERTARPGTSKNPRQKPPPAGLSIGDTWTVTGTWYRRTIQNMIQQPAYCGRKQNFASRGNKGMRHVEPVTLSAERCPPIVDRALWEAVQPKLTENKAKSVYNRVIDPESAWLRGQCWCGGCGWKMRTTAANRFTGPRYTCNYMRSDGVRCEAPATISASRLDRGVVATVREFLEQPIWLNRQAEHLAAAVEKLASDIAVKEARLTLLNQRKANVKAGLELATTPAVQTEVMGQLASIIDEITHWAEERAALIERHKETVEQHRLCKGLADQGVNYWPSFAGVGDFDQMGYTEWSSVFARWKPRVVVYQEGHSPRWQISFDAVQLEAAAPFVKHLTGDPTEPVQIEPTDAARERYQRIIAETVYTSG
ncbi:MAG: recombinase family protein, partial [Dehalococcoidia bacterium]